MKNCLIVVLFSTGILIGLGYCSSTKAADVEIILGTSSAFNVVRGTTVAGGTSTIYVGSATVSIGTTTKNAMFYVAGSSTSGNDASLRVRNSSGADTLSVRNDGAILIGTNTSTLDSALYVGSATSGSLGTITAGFLSIGTITANVALHGTTTVQFPGILSVGTITGNLAAHGTTTVHFPGGINVTGPKNFLIPHPDPQKRDMGWVLRHSCIESPTRGDTLYRYKVEIESDGGEAFIDLPSYWLYLNENSEVWVSPVGQFAQGYGYVDEVLNKLVLKGEKKGFYNVLLIGTRKDQYAKAFDAKGVEYIDPAINELLTRGEKKDAVDVQLIDAHSDRVIKNFMDPIVDRFGLATHQ